MKILSIGEVLWDVFENGEHLGGAPLNFSAASQRLGSTVALLSAVGNDERGGRTLRAIRDLGLTTEFVQQVKEKPTGMALVSTDRDRNALFTIDRPAAFDCVAIDPSLLESTARFAPDWLYFGTLTQSNSSMEQALIRLAESLPKTKRFYDVNLRTGHWNLELVERLSYLTDVLKLNHHEAQSLYELLPGNNVYTLEAFCHHWSSKYDIPTICVSLGSSGCAIFHDSKLRFFRGFDVEVVDTVGAGDAFAAAFLRGLDAGWSIEENAAFANAAGAIVAGRPGATPEWDIEQCYELIRSRVP
jgi:fructokinase